MNNKVELLRSILFTEDDFNTLKGVEDMFSIIDINFMVEFKKIYELGLGQLKKFIDLLDSDGKYLDTYSVIYYVDVLINGPLGQHVRELAKDKKYFTELPDSMGTMGNKHYSPQNTTIIPEETYPLGCATDTFNKLPKFIQDVMETGISTTEEMFRGCFQSSLENDNTLPVIDKKSQERYDKEKTGELVKTAHANLMVKDSAQYLAIKNISTSIFGKVSKSLGDENYRIYKDKKQYDPFSSDKNESTSTNLKLVRTLTEDDVSEDITTDIMGDVFDSEERRKSAIKIETATGSKEYSLNTVEGQLGI